MSNPQYIDNILVEWGARTFWPGNKVKGRFKASGSALPFGSSKPPPNAGQVRARIRSMLKRAPQVMVKITGGGRGMARIGAHLSYISRNGSIELENERGEHIEGREGLSDLRGEWRSTGTFIPHESPRREAFNVMLSMPPDTDADLVRDAARAFAKQEFSNHLYVFALHRPESDDRTERPHVHLSVRAEGLDGRRLNPRKDDLRRWRELFAEALQERGIPALATRRIVHGRLQRGNPTWHKHIAKRGAIIQRPERDLSQKEIQAHTEALRHWGQLAGSMAKSERSEDRETAVLITQMVSEMPSARFLGARLPAARPGIETHAPGLDRS